MKILAIGDVVGDRGTDAVLDNLEAIKRKYSVDFCIVNAENACSANGITRNKAEAILDAGADVITLGNHTFRQKDAYTLLSHNDRVIRPVNYPPETVGKGFTTVEKNGIKVAVFSALGRVHLENVDCPFRALKSAVADSDANIKIVDFHAEATSEKRAMGFYLDGLASVVFGTHTHVQTADAQILPRGTGYITDIGMTGPHHSCLGVEKQIVIERFVNCNQQRFEFSDSAPIISGAVFTVNDDSGKCEDVFAFSILPGEKI